MLFLQNPLTAPKPVVTPAQLQEKLKGVPLYLVVDAKGTPLTATATGGEKTFVMACLRRASAELLLAEIKKRTPELPAEKVVVVSLAQAQARLSALPKPLPLGFIPDPEEVKQALALRKAKGNDKPLEGVPVFYGKIPGKGFLTYTQEEKQIFPVFFSAAELKVGLERYNQIRPSGTPEAEIEVTTLEGLLLQMAAATDPIFQKLIFLPAKAALDEAKIPDKKLTQP